MTSDAGGGAFVLLLIAAIIYFVPAIVAMNRNRAVGPVIAVNLLLGWTFLGWVVALVWALTENTQTERADREAAERAKFGGPQR